VEDEKTDYVPALGHDYSGAAKVVVSTCMEQGYTETQCIRCDATQKNAYTESLGHDFSGKVTVVVNCAEQGYTETQCIRCDETLITDFTDPVPHNVVMIPLKDPTCTEQGVIKIGTMCSRCETVFVQPEFTPALGHDFVNGVCSRCRVNEDGTVSGDLTGDSSVNNDDVVLLLWHTLFSEDYPLEVSGDMNNDSEINNADVVLLLWHTLFPDDYPL